MALHKVNNPLGPTIWRNLVLGSGGDEVEVGKEPSLFGGMISTPVIDLDQFYCVMM